MTAEFVHEGETIRETPTSIELAAGTARAIVTEPVGPARRDLCIAFFSGGGDRRTGPNRLWVATARHWAANGVTAVRIDPPGVGDSDGEEDSWKELYDQYAPEQLDAGVELMDALQARGLGNRFVLAGFCSGAYRALHIAARDPRVTGVVAIGLAFFHWSWWAINVYHSRLADRPITPEDSAAKIRALGMVRRILRVLKAVHNATVFLGQALPNRGERLVARLARRGTDVVFILKGASYAFQQVDVPQRRSRLRVLDRVRVARLPGNDQRFRPLVSQDYVRAVMNDTLSGLLTGQGPQPAPSPPADGSRRTELAAAQTA